MTFRDFYSAQASQYARHRPSYPDALFDYLASLAPANETAWDCGTGNGQAAMALARRFQRVIASDGSAEQIANAFPHERVEYRVEQAGSTTIASRSIDLTTVATAVHWFDLPIFYDEVRRVSKPGAVLAVWTYYLPGAKKEIDEWLDHYFHDVLGPHWPEGVQYVDERYQTLPFPFNEIQPPPFTMVNKWDFDCFVGFLVSWAITKRYIDAEGDQALDDQIEALRVCWGDEDEVYTLTWPLHFRIGRLPG